MVMTVADEMSEGGDFLYDVRMNDGNVHRIVEELIQKDEFSFDKATMDSDLDALYKQVPLEKQHGIKGILNKLGSLFKAGEKPEQINDYGQQTLDSQGKTGQEQDWGDER